MRMPFHFLRTAGTLARAGRVVATWSVSAALVAGGAAAPAGAATQGPIGSSSSGIISITASVPKLAQITGLTDVTFSNVSPTTAATNAQNDCVWSNTATKGYTITATGSGTSGAFTLSSSGATVPYSVQWSATSGQSTGTTLAPGVASAALTSTATTPGCVLGPATTSSLIVSIAAADLQSMVATNSYTGTLTLLVNPQ
jgi:hypothetical protein